MYGHDLNLSGVGAGVKDHRQSRLSHGLHCFPRHGDGICVDAVMPVQVRKIRRLAEPRHAQRPYPVAYHTEWPIDRGLAERAFTGLRRAA